MRRVLEFALVMPEGGGLMAVYQYRCKRCGSDFELMRPMSELDKPATCPKCGGRGDRLISVFASNQGSALQVPAGGPLREAGPKKRSARTKVRTLRRPTAARRQRGHAKASGRRSKRK